MIRWYLVFIQYVALCRAFTTQPPSLWSGGGFDPFQGSWFDTSFQGAQGPGVTHSPFEPLTAPPTVPPTYDTAPSTGLSISLRELIRLAFGNADQRGQGQGQGASVGKTPAGSSKDGATPKVETLAKSSNTISSSSSNESKQVQKLATLGPSTKSVASESKDKATTPKATATPPTTTTTSPTTTTAATTRRPTTRRPTTTTSKPTTPVSVVLTTKKPTVKMTIGEILMLQSKQNAESNQVTAKTTRRRRGCYYQGQFYEPLAEIEKGQTGNWCYGTYCNHAGTVVHWDDHKCGTTAATKPTVTQPTKPTTPKPDQAGMMDIINTARAAGMSMTDLSRFAEMMGMGGGSGTGRTGSSRANGNNVGNANSGLGCLHNGRFYAPGADIENHRDYGRCYGIYCDYNSNIVNWNDRCTATVPPPTGMSGGMGMGMGGQAGLMNQMAIGGQGGADMAMQQMALASLGIEGLGGGGAGGMEGLGGGGAGGMEGMGGGGMAGMSGMGMGGMGMGAQGGMGAQSQGGLSMRQLQQLDLI